MAQPYDINYFQGGFRYGNTFIRTNPNAGQTSVQPYLIAFHGDNDNARQPAAESECSELWS